MTILFLMSDWVGRGDRTRPLRLSMFFIELSNEILPRIPWECSELHSTSCIKYISIYVLGKSILPSLGLSLKSIIHTFLIEIPKNKTIRMSCAPLYHPLPPPHPPPPSPLPLPPPHPPPLLPPSSHTPLVALLALPRRGSWRTGRVCWSDERRSCHNPNCSWTLHTGSGHTHVRTECTNSQYSTLQRVHIV